MDIHGRASRRRRDLVGGGGGGGGVVIGDGSKVGHTCSRTESSPFVHVE